MKEVLVLCTGNSCRSIMAECLINQLGKGVLHALSAGSAPTDYVHPKSIETLERHSIAVGDVRSKSWDEFANLRFDYVITVCDQAAREVCPVFLGEYKKLHWSIPDPAATKGTVQEIDAAFDAAFDLLKIRIEAELIS